MLIVCKAIVLIRWIFLVSHMPLNFISLFLQVLIRRIFLIIRKLIMDRDIMEHDEGESLNGFFFLAFFFLNVCCFSTFPRIVLFFIGLILLIMLISVFAFVASVYFNGVIPTMEGNLILEVDSSGTTFIIRSHSNKPGRICFYFILLTQFSNSNTYFR